jgi:hypothetical protein
MTGSEGDSPDKKVTIHWRSNGDNSLRETRPGDGGGEGNLPDFDGVEHRGDERREDGERKGKGEQSGI